MTEKNLIRTFEELLDIDLSEYLDDTGDLEGSLTRLMEENPGKQLESLVVPQWVVLAAGKGTRIDPESLFNKNIDIWIGEKNVLQLSIDRLPGRLPPIVVVNPQIMERIKNEGKERLLGDVKLAVQEIPNGTGGALAAAVELLLDSDARLLGVAFGDEPFLEKSMFVMTLLDHLVKGAQITLCGKIASTVVGRGGLFFDESGRFIGTREWPEMSEQERNTMLLRESRGMGYTNTGITVADREAVIERLGRLRPHPKNELHHVDLIRHFYEDGLKTNAFIYTDPIPPGVNRWSAVAEGESTMIANTRRRLLDLGSRVDPSADVICYSDRIGRACHFSGEVRIGAQVEIGHYCHIDDSTLSGESVVGDSVRLSSVRAHNARFLSNPISPPLGEPNVGLRTGTEIKGCEFDNVIVGARVRLRSVKARWTIIPDGVNLENLRLGQWSEIDMPFVPRGLLRSDYAPGNPISTEQAVALIEDCRAGLGENPPTARAIEMLSELYRNATAIKITRQELNGIIAELQRLASGEDDPMFWRKLEILASSESRGMNEVEANLSRVLRHLPPEKCDVLFLAGDVADLPADLRVAHTLSRLGYRCTIAGGEVAVGMRATAADIRIAADNMGISGIRVISSGSRMPGINLYQATPQFLATLLNAHLIVCSGTDNFTTTERIEKQRVRIGVATGG